jgi:hypothetical protein
MARLYLVRLIPAFRSPEAFGTKTMFMPQGEGAYTTKEAAERACLVSIPKANPFACHNLQANLEGFSIYWGGEVVDKHWGHDVSYQKINKAILGMGFQPPKSLLPPVDPPPKLSFWQKVKIFLGLPFVTVSLSPSITWGDLVTEKKTWIDWWGENAPKMTDGQKRTMWELLANGSPYEVIEVEFEEE